MTTVSIIIPTYNSESLIRNALDSVVHQRFTDWEVLIMDGGSKDDTVAVSKSYGDSRIHVFSSPDKGVYDAMNKGIKKAIGEWLFFLGSDDYLVDEHVLETVFGQNKNADIIYGEVEASHMNPLHKGEWTMSNIQYNRCHQCIFYRRSVIKKLGGYNLKYPILADYDLNLKWFFSRKISKKHIPLVIAHFSEGGLSGNHQDPCFDKRYNLIVLLRGWSYLTSEERRFYWTEQLNECYLGRKIQCVLNKMKF